MKIAVLYWITHGLLHRKFIDPTGYDLYHKWASSIHFRPALLALSFWSFYLYNFYFLKMAVNALW